MQASGNTDHDGREYFDDFEESTPTVITPVVPPVPFPIHRPIAPPPRIFPGGPPFGPPFAALPRRAYVPTISEFKCTRCYSILPSTWVCQQCENVNPATAGMCTARVGPKRCVFTRCDQQICAECFDLGPLRGVLETLDTVLVNYDFQSVRGDTVTLEVEKGCPSQVLDFDPGLLFPPVCSLFNQIAYTASQNIIVFGDGDFSWSTALLRRIGSGKNVVVTTIDSREEVRKKYTKAHANARFILAHGGTLIYGFDATHRYLYEKSAVFTILGVPNKFDVMVWNFPHTSHPQLSEETVRINRNMLISFARNCAYYAKHQSEMHLTTKIGGHYSRWDVETIGNQILPAGFIRWKGQIEFDSGQWPGYQHRQTNTDTHAEIFGMAWTHIFSYDMELLKQAKCITEANYTEVLWGKNDARVLFPVTTQLFQFSGRRDICDKSITAARDFTEYRALLTKLRVAPLVSEESLVKKEATDVVKREEVKREEVKCEEVNSEAVKREEEVDCEEVEFKEMKREEVKREEVKREEVKREEVKREEVKRGAVEKDSKPTSATEVNSDDSEPPPIKRRRVVPPTHRPMKTMVRRKIPKLDRFINTKDTEIDLDEVIDVDA